MRTRTLLTTVFVAGMLVVAADYATFAATGGSLILGKPNSASSVTGLTRTTAGPALQLNALAGSAPFAVNRSTKVGNLNADLVDGIDGSKLALKQAPVRIYNAAPVLARQVSVPAATPTRVSILGITVPAECGTATRHRYLVEQEAWYSTGGSATLELSLTVDSTSHQFGPGSSASTIADLDSVSTSRVVTLAPGAHVLRTMVNLSTGGNAVDPALRALDMGYTCDSAPTSRTGGYGAPAGRLLAR